MPTGLDHSPHNRYAIRLDANTPRMSSASSSYHPHTERAEGRKRRCRSPHTIPPTAGDRKPPSPSTMSAKYSVAKRRRRAARGISRGDGFALNSRTVNDLREHPAISQIHRLAKASRDEAQRSETRRAQRVANTTPHRRSCIVNPSADAVLRPRQRRSHRDTSRSRMEAVPNFGALLYMPSSRMMESSCSRNANHVSIGSRVDAQESHDTAGPTIAFDHMETIRSAFDFRRRLVTTLILI